VELFSIVFFAVNGNWTSMEICRGILLDKVVSSVILPHKSGIE
jgi:hypothetical protein